MGSLKPMTRFYIYGQGICYQEIQAGCKTTGRSMQLYPCKMAAGQVCKLLGQCLPAGNSQPWPSLPEVRGDHYENSRNAGYFVKTRQSH